MNKVLWWAVVLAVAAYIVAPIGDPDLWWHITVGRWIVAHHTVPRVDYWTLFSAGQPWRAYSWSNEIVFALTESAWGEQGLLWLTFLIAIALTASQSYCLGRISRDWFIGGVLGVFTAVGSFNHFSLRPQSIVWVYFTWLIWNAEAISQEGWSRRRGLALFGLMVLWANSHISTVLGLAVIAAWVYDPDLAPRDRLRLVGKTVGAAFLGTLCTPYLGGEWLTFFSKSGHPFSHRAITEFQSATVMDYSTAFLIILVTILLTFLHKRPATVRASRLLMTAIFVLGGTAIIKFMPFADVLVAAVIAELWRRESADRTVLGNLAEAIARLKSGFLKIPKEGLAFVFACLAFLSFNKVRHYPLDYLTVPAMAVDFIKFHNLPHPLMNDFGSGGYVMYQFSSPEGEPEYKVTIDGRTNMIPPALWQKHYDALTARHSWRDFFDMVKPETILWKTESPLTTVLINGTEWCLIYYSGSTNHGYSVFVKTAYFEQHKTDFGLTQCFAGVPQVDLKEGHMPAQAPVKGPGGRLHLED